MPHYMNCPRCSIKAQTTEVSFPSNTVIRIDGICPKCKAMLFLETPLASVLPKPGFDLEHWEPKGASN